MRSKYVRGSVMALTMALLVAACSDDATNTAPVTTTTAATKTTMVGTTAAAATSTSAAASTTGVTSTTMIPVTKIAVPPTPITDAAALATALGATTMVIADDGGAQIVRNGVRSTIATAANAYVSSDGTYVSRYAAWVPMPSGPRCGCSTAPASAKAQATCTM